MAPLLAASPIRVAIIDDDSGLVTVLDRRFYGIALGARGSRLCRHSRSAGGSPATRGDHQPRDHRAGLPGAAGDGAAGSRAAGVHRGGARGRPGARTARRRRRLDHKAVPSRGASGADPGGDAPPAHGRNAGRRLPSGGRRAADPSRDVRRLRRRSSASLSREAIYQRVWGYTMVRGDRSVDVFVRQLRHKPDSCRPTGATFTPTSGWATGLPPSASTASRLGPSARWCSLPRPHRRSRRGRPARPLVTRRTLRGP
jgi:hypothetical protein